MLLAALNPNDPLNEPARNAMGQTGIALSPFSLLEMNLLARAGKIEIRDFDNFARDLSALLDVYSIRTLNDSPEYHSEASRLESKFQLTFFDSLHGAVSRVRKEIIASFDRAYDRLGSEGIRRLDPREL